MLWRAGQKINQKHVNIIDTDWTNALLHLRLHVEVAMVILWLKDEIRKCRQSISVEGNGWIEFVIFPTVVRLKGRKDDLLMTN